jgi:hypothetical protein
MFQTKFVEKIKTHILCSVIFFFENPAVCEVVWENIVERGRPQVTKWRKHMAWWIPKTTSTHSEYVKLIALSLQWLDEIASMLRHTYVACIFLIFFISR